MTVYKDIKRIPIVAADVPNLAASKITSGTLDNARITLDAAEIPNLDTAKITTGTMADARISAGSVTQHVAATDLTPVRQDVLTLALKQAIQENSTKFNLTNSAITKFEADADFNLAGSTDIGRNASEYISPITEVAGAYSNDANTVLLLHFNGNFTDSSSNAVTFTAQNSAATSTTHKKFGTHSMFLDGVNQYVSTGSLSGLSSPAAPTTGDFTVDYQVYFQEAWGTNRRHWTFGNNGTPSGSANSGLTVSWNSATSWNHYMSTTNMNFAITYPSYNAWHHYAVMRKSGTLYFYLDGVQKGNSSALGAFNQLGGDANLFLGIRSGSTAEWYKDYMDEFRYSDNARYSTPGNGSTAFTPPADSTAVNATGTALGTTNVPTSAVTEVSGVMLLKHAYGANTLGTDVKVYFTADNSNWTEVTSGDFSDAGTFSTGIKMIKMAKKTVTSGSDVRWKVVYANQSASSKEAHIYGIGLNY